ncbi:hypothetical protein [Halpernia frigidisoli]|uniref:Outer membrane protein beta-barrel domain-containing protein n=1 Tax=Halpernia frigidisoli TaxID=1125876 RepID=A0A1I3GN96_9FLAO|nr:hypothetical protein [Halpernia frigidisoli]SFI24934.1 hypothetical protein SAMN05443292_1938 [Halpernia frigidisoli]
MRKFYLFLIFLPLFFLSQKKKPIEILGSLDGKVLVMKSFGNNQYNKTLEPFVGFGFGLNFLTNIKNFGVGFNYFLLKASGKLDQINVFGNLSAPQMSLYEANIIHQNKLDEELLVEEFVGLSVYRVKSKYISSSQNYLQGNNGFNLGSNLAYTLDPEGFQQIYLGAKFNFYDAKIINENPEIQKFFSRAYFASLILGYRYNF